MSSVIGLSGWKRTVLSIACMTMIWYFSAPKSLVRGLATVAIALGLLVLAYEVISGITSKKGSGQ
jgi:Na+-transporting NADH:ubiquinone oxidoreductase subunit NqrE